jgi:hypothetical protein
MRAARTVAAAILLVTVPAGTALAHKSKLPSDALSLVRQAAALLAQDPKMQGEARERLEAALASKDVRGVDLTQVKQALDALAAGDIPAARRALTGAVISGTASTAAPPEAAASGSGPAAGMAPMTAGPSGSTVAQPAVSSPADTIAAMKMSEPLVARFGRSPGELATLFVGIALIAVGLGALRRER